MDRIYFDNAASTPLDPLVLEAMMPFLSAQFGNPSSIYSYGRETRMAIEQARKSVAKNLGARPSEIFFTSGGTESTNTILNAAIENLGCTHIISSPIEHHATLHTVLHLAKKENITLSFVQILPNGHIDMAHLEALLNEHPVKTIVTIMHANNEIGNMIELNEIGALCKKHNAYFHSDTVQTVGHFAFDLSHTPVDFITGASHKFHGPKGIGILYINENIKINPFIHGGAQERNMRAGTENVYGIVGFAKALEIATANYEKDSHYISALKKYLYDALIAKIPGISFNGDPFGNSLYNLLSVNFPKSEKTEMLLFNLDIHHICASGGSACSSGAQQGSHVIQALNKGTDIVTVRFSFSKHNTKAEIDTVVHTLTSLL
ncbi:MAG: cysteine desulfurase family protein [Bacteroidetes bacterium]|nr:cysteine desulfurase family protein [Bacteroidota bacterium]